MPKNNTTFIRTDYADGRYTWRRSTADDPSAVEVSLQLVELWFAIDSLDRVMQEQLQRLDNEVVYTKEKDNG